MGVCARTGATVTDTPALTRFRLCGTMVFGQHRAQAFELVVTREVHNDSAAALANLSEVLFDAGVLPYYLHMLDPVEGAAHFEVPEDRARRLQTELTNRLPGYLVPRLVREVEGAPAKVGVDLWR